MKLFLDTASIEEIREINRWGVLGGVTTNPSLLAHEAADPDKVWRQILEEVPGDVSLEVTAGDADGMYEQGIGLAAMGPNAIVKVPMTPDGLEAGRRLTDEGHRVNVTLVFSPAQAILAAEIGAYIVSPFLGRLDDVASDGMALLGNICDLYAVQGYETKVLAASLRHPMHVVESAVAGADIATMPYDVFTKLVKHPLTDIGLERFSADWQKLQTELEGEAPR
ncbi:MAG TPA: fructose-6-phosphate aldolase [Actinomycetota bacterium]|nr:fructose-6-phosphate aldolase [Actinomycetota bacterium]